MSLHQLQAWLQSAISIPARGDLAAQAGDHLQATAQLGAHARLGIYQRSYRARLLQSFHAMFPGLLHALGADMLDKFALDFLEHSPPRHHSVNRIADGFAEHLQRTRPASEPGINADWADFIIDLARLETALLGVSEAHGLEHATTTDAANVRELPDESLLQRRPRHAPCLRLLACSHPVHDYLQALRADNAPGMPKPRPTWLALTRVAWRLSTRELAPVQWELLARLDGQTTVAQALRAVAALNPQPLPTTELARIWLGNFLAQGLLESV
ncbi:DNA-binding domain-containing protein [Ramlibacter sp. WS9]|uniref:HvfC/BufC N-terminal domain-containing protein n=1 Tax=Ramlibacter sp. WS9 TaxID=1882741 RepID=UPI0013053546|nr:DNA-binding domain-containing protein [Ramlibacter sp. WS9]